MGKKYEERVRFVGDFDPQDILKGIRQIQNQLNNTNVNSDITKSYISQLNNLEKKTTGLMARINKGFSSDSEINAFEKEITAAFTQFISLSDKFKEQKIDFSDIILTDEVRKKFDNLKKNINDYITKLKTLSGERVQKIQNTGLLDEKGQEKLNKTLSIKDDTERKNRLIVEKSGYEEEANKNLTLLKQEKDELEKLNKEYKNLLEIKKDLQDVSDQKNNLEKELKDIRTSANAYAEENRTVRPIKMDYGIHGSFQGNEIKYKDAEGKETSIDLKSYNEKLALLDKLKAKEEEIAKIENDISKNEESSKPLKESIANREAEIDKLQKIKVLYDILSGNVEELSDDEKKVFQEIIKWTEEVKETNRNLQNTEKQVEDIKHDAKSVATEAFQNMAKESENLGKKCENAGNGVDGMRTSLEDIEKGNTFFNQLKNRIGMVMDLGSAFNYAERMTRYTFNAIKDLDAAFTEISVVTDKTNEQLWKSFGSYNDMAQKLGVTTKDAIETSALYYQQGLDTAEVMSLTEETIKMARIAGMDFAEATDRMTAALRGFKLEMEDANRVNDVFSALAAESAVDTNELSYALTKTASIAKSAGMELETTSAFLSQMIETTREAPVKYLTC